MTQTKKKFINKFDLLNYSEKEGSIFLPNEIFQHLHESIENSKHVAFAYSYYYLISYLYRYCKYSSMEQLTQTKLKEILGVSSTNKDIDYIIKQDGVLDQMGYTETTTDFPVYYELDEHKRPYFTTIREVKDIKIKNTRNFKIKYPVKAFYRTQMARDNQYENGTFYEVKNTHKVSTQTFIRCMQDNTIGHKGFYLFAYLKKNIDFQYGNWFAVSYEEISKELKLSRTTISKYIEALEQKSYISVKHMDFKHNPERFANEYRLIAK